MRVVVPCLSSALVTELSRRLLRTIGMTLDDVVTPEAESDAEQEDAFFTWVITVSTASLSVVQFAHTVCRAVWQFQWLISDLVRGLTAQVQKRV